MSRARVSDIHSIGFRTCFARSFILEGKNEELLQLEMLGLTGLKHTNESYVEQL